MRIRPFVSEDATEASRIIHEALKLNQEDYPKHVLTFMRDFLSAQNLLKLSSEREFFVAEEDAVIVGTVGLNGEEIISLFVPEEFGGKGIGTALMTHAEEILRKRGHLKTVIHSSITAVGFYEKIGYEKIEEVERDGFGKSMVMEKEL